MNRATVIRNETDADVSTITQLTVAAFKTLEISNHTEQFIIEALRAAKALTLSLVAEVRRGRTSECTGARAVVLGGRPLAPSRGRGDPDRSVAFFSRRSHARD